MSLALSPGYHGYMNGLYFPDGANWTCFEVPLVAGGNRKFRLTNSVPGTVRIVPLLTSGTVINATIETVGNVFQVPENATYFAANIQLPNANPSTTATTVFTDASDFKINEFTNLVTNAIATQPLSADRTMRVLMVGNSFSLDSLQYLNDICRSANVKVTLGIAYESNGSLGDILTKIRNNTPMNSYHKWIDNNYTVTNDVLLDRVVTDEKWDIITYQQSSINSGNYTSFQPALNDVHTYVKSRATNPGVRFGLHMTWAYADGSTNLTNAGFASQTEMYEAIVKAYTQALQSSPDFEILIPVGTAIQNARTNTQLNAIGNGLTRDGIHLNMGAGRYIAALAVFETLIAPNYIKDTFTDVSFVPSNQGVTNSLATLSKQAARDSSLTPFNVTNL